MEDKTIEQEILDKGLTLPRVTPADIEANIASEHYFTAEDGVGRANKGQTSFCGKNPVSLSLLTFCVLVLRNGFTVAGESACASPENFDAELGRKIARQNAVQKVWGLMGYELKSRLNNQKMIVDDNEAVTITKQEYDSFLYYSSKLNALERAGVVDNWSGYDYAMELFSQKVWS